MNVWIDIDNPPQVQYLIPFKRVYEQLGATVTLTARDNGITRELLRAEGEPAVIVGAEFGEARWRKLSGVGRRAWALRSTIEGATPDLLLSASRSAVLLAWQLGIPAFVICDYEYVELSIFRRLGASLFFPAVIGLEPFRARGFLEQRLLPFEGLKEDITFSRLAPNRAISPDPFAGVDDQGGVRVLVRPPHEESHYFTERSRSMTQHVLARLSADNNVRLVYSPRLPHQREYLTGLEWTRTPIVLDRPLPMLTLLDHVDLVVTGGGTMAREAAYLGVPAYSVFGGQIGGVDRYLVREGRLVLLRTPGDLSELRVERLSKRTPMPRRVELAEEIARRTLEVVKG